MYRLSHYNNVKKSEHYIKNILIKNCKNILCDNEYKKESP